MFGRITPEFQCLEGKDQNSKVWKDKVRIPMFGGIGPEFQYLEGLRQNSNIWKDKVAISNVWKDLAIIPTFRRIRKE